MNQKLKKFKCDFHIHVKSDPKDHHLKHNIKMLILEAEKQHFDVLAITNHQQIFNISKFQKFAQKHNILLIKGIELNIKLQHVIILFPHRSVLKIKSFADLNKYKKQHPKSIIIAPHPFYMTPTCLGKNLINNIELFDAIEYCHFYTKWFNTPNNKVIQVAKKFNKTIVGNSDVHKLMFFGTTYSEIYMNKLTPQNIKKAVKNPELCKFISHSIPSKLFLFYSFKNIFFFFWNRLLK